MNTIDLETEIEKLAASGVKNHAQTLNLSRLMVRAEDLDTRKSILMILLNAEQPCRYLSLNVLYWNMVSSDLFQALVPGLSWP